MNIKRAREILGKEGEGISDAQIEGIIKLFDLYSKLVISQHIAEKKEKIRKETKKEKPNFGSNKNNND